MYILIFIDILSSQSPLKAVSEVQRLLQECQYDFFKSIEKFKKINEPILISSLYLDMAFKFKLLSTFTEDYNFKNMVCLIM